MKITLTFDTNDPDNGADQENELKVCMQARAVLMAIDELQQAMRTLTKYGCIDGDVINYRNTKECGVEVVSEGEGRGTIKTASPMDMADLFRTIMYEVFNKHKVDLDL